MKKKIALTLVCLLLIIGIVPLGFLYNKKSEEKVFAQNEPITAEDIKDSNLYTWLQLLADTPQIYPDTFNDPEITEINFSNKQIKSLEGLELLNFGYVEKVDFSGNQINVIPKNAFYSMKQLNFLDLSKNNLEKVAFTSYAKNIDLSFNKIVEVTIYDSNLNLLNLSENLISNSENINVLTGNETQALDEENYEILLYNNNLAGYNLKEGAKVLSNAYLGIQGLKNSVVYSDSTLAVYPYKKINVLRTITEDNQQINKIFESNLHVQLITKPNENGEYTLVKKFAPTSLTVYDSIQLKSGRYALRFVDDWDNQIFDYISESVFDEDIQDYVQVNEFITEEDYDSNPQKVVKKEYQDILLTAKPYERNVHLMHNGTIFAIDASIKGPAKLEILSTIQSENLYFLYSVNESNFNVYDQEKGIFIDKSGVYTINLKVVENGVESDSNAYLVRVLMPGKLTLKHYIGIAVASIAVIAAFWIFSKKNKHTTIKDDFNW